MTRTWIAISAQLESTLKYGQLSRMGRPSSFRFGILLDKNVSGLLLAATTEELMALLLCMT